MRKRSRFEYWPFLIFVFLLPFPTLFSSRILGVQLQLSDLAFVAAFFIWLLIAISRRELIRLDRFYLFIGLYFAAVLLSTATSTDPAGSAVKLAGKLYLGSIAFLTYNVVDSIRLFKRTLQAWLAAASVVLSLSLVGILLFYLGVTEPSTNPIIHPIYGSLPPGNYPRVEGFFLYPSMLCNFLGVTWVFAVIFILNGWVKERYFWTFGILLFVVNTFTLTPGLGGIFLTSGYLVWELGKRAIPRASLLSILGGVVMAVIFLAAASVTLFSYGSDGDDMPLASGELSLSHRAMAWSTAFDTFRQHPFLGRGVGMPVADARYTDPSGNNQILTDAHNTYLSVLAETGLLGFLTFIGLVTFVIWRVMKWRAKDDIARWIRLCILLAFADAFFYQGLTGSYEDARHLWVLIGLAAAAARGGIFHDGSVSEQIHSDEEWPYGSARASKLTN